MIGGTATRRRAQPQSGTPCLKDNRVRDDSAAPIESNVGVSLSAGFPGEGRDFHIIEGIRIVGVFDQLVRQSYVARGRRLWRCKQEHRFRKRIETATNEIAQAEDAFSVGPGRSAAACIQKSARSRAELPW